MEQEYARTDVDRARDLYAIISNGELGDDAHSVDMRVNIVRELERLTCADFKDTAAFHRTVGSFIMRESSGGDRLKRFREAKGWKQGELAIHLGLPQSVVAQMEGGKRPLSDRANSLIATAHVQSSTVAPLDGSTGLSGPKNSIREV